ncbi:hypothetical protein QM334_36930, partial [Burkholderia cenocepacia]|nr:hypothetical protein [Burkholderia cenocepacia]
MRSVNPFVRRYFEMLDRAGVRSRARRTARNETAARTPCRHARGCVERGAGYWFAVAMAAPASRMPEPAGSAVHDVP